MARTAGWLVLGVFAALAVFEVAVNVFLASGGLARLASGNPDKVLISYRRAWSLLPGRAHARDVRVRSKDGNVEFDLRVDSCDFRWAPLDLAERRFHITEATASGVRFLARRRLEPGRAIPRVLEALPAIEGLEPVPIKPPPEPPVDDAHYHLFTIQIDRVDATAVREIWVDALRFVGEARVRGGFFLKPARWAAVGPVVADFSSGVLTTAQRVIAEPLIGHVETIVESFDPRLTDGAGVWRRVDVRLRLSGRVDDWRFGERLLPEGWPFRVRRGRGLFEAEVHLKDGAFAGEARLAIERARLDLASGKSASGEVRARLVFRPAPDERETTELAGSRIEVLGASLPDGSEGWWAHLALLQARFTSAPALAWRGQLDLEARDTKPFASAFVASQQWPAWLVPLLSSDGLEARASVEVRADRAIVQDLVATAGPFRLDATLVRRGRSSRTLALVADGPLAAGVEDDDGDGRLQVLDPASWYAHERRALLAPFPSR